ncbi:hypothetical protein KIPB_007195, partial [Kipferlia bialata]|eukprot:g7195.t1
MAGTSGSRGRPSRPRGGGVGTPDAVRGAARRERGTRGTRERERGSRRHSPVPTPVAEEPVEDVPKAKGLRGMWQGGLKGVRGQVKGLNLPKVNMPKFGIFGQQAEPDGSESGDIEGLEHSRSIAMPTPASDPMSAAPLSGGVSGSEGSRRKGRGRGKGRESREAERERRRETKEADRRAADVVRRRRQEVADSVSLKDRQRQCDRFCQEINPQLNDVHKSYLKVDTKARTAHMLWIALWGVLLGLIMVILVASTYLKVVLTQMTYAFFFFLFLEYALMFGAIKMAVYPHPPEMSREERRDPVPTAPGRVALVIPVGWGSAGLSVSAANAKRAGKMAVLTNTLDASKKVFAPTDVFVWHNSSDAKLPDRVVQGTCDGRAVYCPFNIGSKSLCAYYGAMLAHWLGYEYVIVMDDDTQLPMELRMVLDGQLDADAYCMAISAACNDENPDIRTETLVAIQDIEYKLSDMAKMVQSHWKPRASVLSPHGAINMWRTDILLSIMREHNCIFHGEDYQMGVILRMSHPKERLGIISEVIVDTVAPATLDELYNQRLTSWDMAAHQFLWGGFCASEGSGYYPQVLCCLPCNTDNLYIRLATLEDIWTAAQDYLRVPLLMYHIILSLLLGDVNWIIAGMYFVTIGAQWVIAACLEYVKFKERPDLAVKGQAGKMAIALFPLYRFGFSFVRVLAMLRFMGRYDSIKRDAVPIAHMGLPIPHRDRDMFPVTDTERRLALKAEGHAPPTQAMAQSDPGQPTAGLDANASLVRMLKKAARRMSKNASRRSRHSSHSSSRSRSSRSRGSSHRERERGADPRTRHRSSRSRDRSGRERTRERDSRRERERERTIDNMMTASLQGEGAEERRERGRRRHHRSRDRERERQTTAPVADTFMALSMTKGTSGQPLQATTGKGKGKGKPKRESGRGRGGGREGSGMSSMSLASVSGPMDPRARRNSPPIA